jgi:hypothetical protein
MKWCKDVICGKKSTYKLIMGVELMLILSYNDSVEGLKK